MFKFIKKILSIESLPEIESNTIYQYKRNTNNPFAEPPHQVRVKAVKDGWVNYTFLPETDFFNNESMQLNSFRDIYSKLIGKSNESI